MNTSCVASFASSSLPRMDFALRKTIGPYFSKIDSSSPLVMSHPDLLSTHRRRATVLANQHHAGPPRTVALVTAHSLLTRRHLASITFAIGARTQRVRGE